jgi:hypothetical protein
VPVPQPYLSYRPEKLHRLAKLIPRNRFLGSINVYKYGLCCTIGFLQYFKLNGNRTEKDVLVQCTSTCETFEQFIGKVEKREEDFSLLNVLIRVKILQWPGMFVCTRICYPGNVIFAVKIV